MMDISLVDENVGMLCVVFSITQWQSNTMQHKPLHGFHAMQHITRYSSLQRNNMSLFLLQACSSVIGQYMQPITAALDLVELH